MRVALAQAREAAAAGEIPVGAALVRDGELIASGRNAPVRSHDPSAHAEIVALRSGAAALRNYRLDGCELFVTLEPCAMCAGAMLHARLDRVVFGAPDPKTGAAGSVIDLFGQPALNHRTQVRGGVLAEACGELLRDFFREQRATARASADPLRDDAVRTPQQRFAGLGEPPTPSYGVSDLPSLHGWRMHYVDEQPNEAAFTCLCLHGPGEWGYFFRHVHGFPKVRVLTPDLVGFGKSDKPKRESVHTLAWHAQVLHEFLERLQPAPLMLLIHSARAAPLASLLQQTNPGRFALVCEAPDAGPPAPDAWRAPFPDRGHEAALRALGPIEVLASGPTHAQACEIVQGAMGYFRP